MSIKLKNIKKYIKNKQKYATILKYKGVIVKLRLFRIVLFILCAFTIYLVINSPAFIFSTSYMQKVRQNFSKQKISPTRLFISTWRMAKASYVDPSMNHQNWFKWKKRYVNNIKTYEDAFLAISSMLASLNDNNTKFYNKKQTKNISGFIEESNLSKQKVKVTSPQQLTQKTNLVFKKPAYIEIPKSAVVQLKTIAGFVEYAVVSQTSPNFPEVCKNDLILYINGHTLNKMDQNSAIELIRKIDEKSKVIILRNNKLIVQKIRKNAVEVDKINITKTKDNIIYISLHSLMGKTAHKKMEKILQEHKNAKGFIIDLRGDMGGLFLNALYIADEFIKEGDIVTINYRNGHKYTLKADPGTKYNNQPIVILIDRRTASSSEILAGALRNNNLAILVGEKTYGKSSIQQLIPMSDETSLGITIAKYSFENCITEDSKIKPDYEVPLNYKNFMNDNDEQLNLAYKLINNQSKK